jgi:hypothetical protein
MASGFDSGERCVVRKWARAASLALLTLRLIGLLAGARRYVTAVPAISADDPHFDLA